MTPKKLVAVRLEKHMINAMVNIQNNYDLTLSQIIRSSITMFLDSKETKKKHSFLTNFGI